MRQENLLHFEMFLIHFLSSAFKRKFFRFKSNFVLYGSFVCLFQLLTYGKLESVRRYHIIR